MSLIANCLKKLVVAKQITEAAAKAALAVHEGVQGKLTGAMPPSNADAGAALEAAKIMAASAKAQKLTIAKNAIALRAAMDRVDQHPHSKAAGLMAILTPDIREKGGINVESLGKYYEGVLYSKANDLINSYNSKLAGLSHDVLGPRKVIREGFGEDTGDEMAKQAHKAWAGSVDEGIALIERAGRVFRSQAERDTWRFMQFWDTSRLRTLSRQKDAGREGSYFSVRVMDNIQRGGLEVIDRDTGQVATGIQVPGIVQRAWNDIIMNQSPGAMGRPFNDNMRVFRFKTSEAYLDLMDEFGIGKNAYYPAMVGHLRSMAHEASMVSVLGPSYHANFRALVQPVKKEDALKGPSLNPIRFVESAHAAERTFKMLTGETNSIESEAMAGIFGALRNIATGANLGGAVATAIPGDTVTAVLARQHLGIPAARAIIDVAQAIASDAKGKQLAARLQINSHAAIDNLGTAARFGGEFDGQAKAARLAELVIRGQGLGWWTHVQQRAFSMDMLGHIAHVADQPLDQLDVPFRNFLIRHKLGDDWDAIRASQLYEVEGATYFDPSAMGDRGISDRLMSAIMDERQYAILEAGARVRGMLSGGLKKGTFWGEIARSAGMYKSFAMSVILTHGMRSVSTGSIAERGYRLGKFITLMTLAGAVSQQAKSLLAGKDPRSMDNPLFWFDAFVTGGGSGIYGDLLKTQTDPRFNTDLVSLLGGPPVQLVQSTSDLTVGNVRDLVAGKSTHAGRDLAKFMQKWTPNTWYTRAVMDRYVHDEIQSLVDPDYRGARRRQEKRLQQNTGQKFWWKPGTLAPQRAPQLP